MKYFITVLLSCISCLSIAQVSVYDIFKDCPIGGVPANFDDSMKNRYTIPTIYTSIDFGVLSHAKYTDTIPAEAISVEGYCILVKDGGSETCNCKSKDHDTWDVHIELTKDSLHLSNKDAIVCEINGRVKYYMKSQGVDWSMPAVRKLILHHRVRISGYWFSDDHHKQNSVVDSPDGTDNWRISTIEVHPVTEIKLLD